MAELMFPPAFLFIAAAMLIPMLKGRVRDTVILATPVVGFLQLMLFANGSYLELPFLTDYKLVLLEVSPLRMCFAYVFVIIAFLSSLYAIHVKNNAQHVSAFVYIGSSLGVVFAGDYFTLFIYWEIMAVASACIILCRGNRASRQAAYRYLLVHVAGGACLMAGIVFQLHESQSLAVVTPVAGSPAFYLILIGFCLNAAVPPLSAWLSDAYPEASVTGSVYLTTYTTKTAVFVLALVFAGTESLVWFGAIMTLYGVVFATMENDIRRLLSYHIISQVGYMVCGVGLGTELAINGSSAHAFSHILYKALLFMGTGAVIQATGRRRMTELGGIWRLMPATMIFYMIAGFSISGVPLFNGFISKSMIISASIETDRWIIELMLTLAAVGTFFSTTLKLPYYTFFSRDRGIEVTPLPKNMIYAMGGAAFLCTLFGVFPGLLYRLLPFGIEYHPYTRDHVVGSLQLLIATGIGFMLFIRRLGGHHTITLDTDWLYRKTANAVMAFSAVVLTKGGKLAEDIASQIINGAKELVNPRALTEEDKGEQQPFLVSLARNNVRESIGFGVAMAAVIIIFYMFVFFGTNLIP
jgi:multicomponent Na+:H+ antiporter subunit D